MRFATLYAEGVRTLVATPHLLVPRLATDAAIGRELDLQRRAFDRLAEAVARENELPALGLGQEIWAPDAATIRRVVARPDVGLGGSRGLAGGVRLRAARAPTMTWFRRRWTAAGGS